MLTNVPVSKLMLSISKAILKNDTSFIFTLLSKTTFIHDVCTINQISIWATIEQGASHNPRPSLPQSTYKINEKVKERMKEHSLMQKQRKQLHKHDFHFNASAQFHWERISEMEGRWDREKTYKKISRTHSSYIHTLDNLSNS